MYNSFGNGCCALLAYFSFVFHPRDIKEEIKLKPLTQWIKSLFIIWTTYFGAADWQWFTFPFLKYMNKMSEPQHPTCENSSFFCAVFCCFWTKQSGTGVHYPRAKEYMWHINFPRTTSEHNWKPIRKNSTVLIQYYKCIITFIRLNNLLCLDCCFYRTELKVSMKKSSEAGERLNISQCFNVPMLLM